MKKIFFVFFVLILAIGIGLYKSSKKNELKLYWFIPDGLRAEPDLFQIYKWANEGKMPNLKKLMDRGSFGYSQPNFPNYSPVSWATLLTGTYSEIHGINDTAMHTIGQPLNKASFAGFSSLSRKIPAIWDELGKNKLKVTLISIPGSTPPEANQGETIKGRWGGWGADFFALIFESVDGSKLNPISRANKFLYSGVNLTQYIKKETPKDWSNAPTSFSPAEEIKMIGWGMPIYGYVYDSTNDNQVNYDRAVFSLDKKNLLADLKQGDWSSWAPITLKWQVADKSMDIKSDFRVSLIKLDSNGFFRVRVYYNNLNEEIVQPRSAADTLRAAIGPMVDFPDNFPPQLGYYPEDKKIFTDEVNMALNWHKQAVSAVIDKFKSNVVIHDTYTSNQFLASKWWTGYLDPQGAHYKDISDDQRQQLWSETQNMYKKIDDILGEILKKSDKNTYIVFSSDHGMMPLNRDVYLNNLFAKKGWLKFSIDSKTNNPIVDWKNSRVIYFKVDNIYINPKGLDGIYQRASGTDYENLRNQVIQALQEVKDDNNTYPITKIVKWEDLKSSLHLDPDRSGDLTIEHALGYESTDDMTTDLKLFATPEMLSGYKQAVDPTTTKDVWAPFVIVGPGIKANNFLGNQPINHLDQYPTILKALKIKIPNIVQGKPLPVFQ